MLFRNISIFLAVCSVIAMWITLNAGLFWTGFEFLAAAILMILAAGYCHVEGL